MINKAIVAGNLTRDPELRYTGQGTAVLNMTVACNYRVKNGDEWTDKAEYIGVVVWGKRAENLTPYLSKGSPVFAMGRIETRSWEQDGQKRYKTEVIAEEVKFLGKKEEIPQEHTDIEPF